MMLYCFAVLLSFSLTMAFNKVKHHCHYRRKTKDLSMRWGMKSDVSPSPSGSVPFEIRGFSLPLVVFSAGAALTASSFAGFISNQGGSEGGAVSSLGFVYGIPIFLIGLSLWYAEIPPVPVTISSQGEKAWNKYGTATLVKIRKDVTRHRYGDYAHLDTTLSALGLKLPQKKYPKLLSINIDASNDGQVQFKMIFESLETPYKLWADPDRLERYAKFFGPGVTAAVEKIDSEKKLVALVLTTAILDGANRTLTGETSQPCEQQVPTDADAQAKDP